jgi:hypothetical protein
VLEDLRFAARANARVLVLEGDSVRRIPLSGAITVVGRSGHCQVPLNDPAAPLEAALIRARGGAFEVRSRHPARPVRLNEDNQVVSSFRSLPSNSVILTEKAQILFLYDFDARGRALDKPLKRAAKARLLRQVANLSLTARKTIKKILSNSRRAGATPGEILVREKIITPLMWRIVYSQTVKEPSRRMFLWRR